MLPLYRPHPVVEHVNAPLYSRPPDQGFLTKSTTSCGTTSDDLSLPTIAVTP